MTRVLGFGLVAALLGAAAGIVIAMKMQPVVEPPAEVPATTDLRPPEASFDPIFEPCAHCHQIGAGARMTTGPSLQGVIGRKAGAFPGYPFSDAMRNSGLVWDKATLGRFIASPQAVVPGTRMVFAGIDDAKQRAALLDFIERTGGQH